VKAFGVISAEGFVLTYSQFGTIVMNLKEYSGYDTDSVKAMLLRKHKKLKARLFLLELNYK